MVSFRLLYYCYPSKNFQATTVGGAPHHMTMVTPPESLEAQLQRASQVHRVRISELFHDYDPLRSSYITCESI